MITISSIVALVDNLVFQLPFISTARVQIHNSVPVATAFQLDGREDRVDLRAHEEQLVAPPAPGRLYVHISGIAISDSIQDMCVCYDSSGWFI